MNPTFATLDEVIASNDRVYHLWCIRAWVFAEIANITQPVMLDLICKSWGM